MSGHSSLYPRRKHRVIQSVVLANQLLQLVRTAITTLKINWHNYRRQYFNIFHWRKKKKSKNIVPMKFSNLKQNISRNKYILPWKYLVENSISEFTLEIQYQWKLCNVLKKKKEKKRSPKLIFELQGTPSLSDKVYACVTCTRPAKTCNFHVHATTFPSTRKFRSYLGVTRVHRVIFVCNVYTYAYKYNNKTCSQQCLFQLRWKLRRCG